MSPIIVDKEQKKREILKAATRVFSKLGIPNTNMIDIAREAGIGKGTIYEYFRSKDDIINETFRDFISGLNAVDHEALASRKNPLDKLMLVIEGWISVLTASPDEMRVILDFWADSTRMRNSEYMDQLTSLYEGYRDFLEGIIIEGIESGVIRKIDPKNMASLIAGTLDGITLHWIINPDLLNLKESVELYKENLALAIKAD